MQNSSSPTLCTPATVSAGGHLPLVRSSAQQRPNIFHCKVLQLMAVHSFLYDTVVDCSHFLTVRNLLIDYDRAIHCE